MDKAENLFIKLALSSETLISYISKAAKPKPKMYLERKMTELAEVVKKSPEQAPKYIKEDFDPFIRGLAEGVSDYRTMYKKVLKKVQRNNF